MIDIGGNAEQRLRNHLATTVACCELLAQDESLPERARELAHRALVAALAAADDAAVLAGRPCTESAGVDRWETSAE